MFSIGYCWFYTVGERLSLKAVIETIVFDVTAEIFRLTHLLLFHYSICLVCSLFSLSSFSVIFMNIFLTFIDLLAVILKVSVFSFKSFLLAFIYFPHVSDQNSEFSLLDYAIIITILRVFCIHFSLPQSTFK